MRVSSEELSEIVQKALVERAPFVLYRHPFGGEVAFMTCTASDIEIYTDFKEIREEPGFVFAPFHPSPLSPILFLPNVGKQFVTTLSSVAQEANNPLLAASRREDPVDAAKYKEVFRTFSKRLRDRDFDKLVLSWRATTSPESPTDPIKTFWRACRRYPDAFVSLFYSPVSGLWLGATPEVLLKKAGVRCETVALAGTMKVDDAPLESICWDEKNREEQQMVSRYIVEQLEGVALTLVQSDPYTARAGNLCHIKTDFRFAVGGDVSLGEIVEKLHPTPAVCGVPKDAAKRFIMEQEGYDRTYYSGFLGPLNDGGKSAIYVNIRCMKMNNGSDITLYAGGGLTGKSNEEEERCEIEAKMLTMKRLLQ
ncbi:MAG: isochorismate synthase [Porphyromonas sp.]|nr:isochorismate synthase [Porphyromonas sp.]